MNERRKLECGGNHLSIDVLKILCFEKFPWEEVFLSNIGRRKSWLLTDKKNLIIWERKEIDKDLRPAKEKKGMTILWGILYILYGGSWFALKGLERKNKMFGTAGREWSPRKCTRKVLHGRRKCSSRFRWLEEVGVWVGNGQLCSPTTNGKAMVPELPTFDLRLLNDAVRLTSKSLASFRQKINK